VRGMVNPTTRTFVRDRLTWLAYLMLAYYAYVPGIFGPVMPFLRSELNLSYTLGGLHLTAFSAGMILTGLFGSALSRRFGRGRILWGGGVGIATGGLALALGRSVSFTLPSALLMGLCGSFIQFTVQAVLSDRHGEWRAVALTEANIGASLSNALAPLLVAGFTRLGLGWRFVLYLVVVLIAALALGFHRVTIPNETNQELQLARPHAKGAMPLAYWGFWVSIVLFVALEWCLWVWGAEFIIARFGFSKVAASTIMGIFLAIGVAGRIIGSRMARKYETSSLLLIALGFCLIGFPFFWQSPWAALSIVGLCIAGLGVANLFPLTMTLAVGSAPQQSDLASARISLAVGLAGVSAPLGLGWLADQVGIHRAYIVIAVFLAAGFLLTLALRRLALSH